MNLMIAPVPRSRAVGRGRRPGKGARTSRSWFAAALRAALGTAATSTIGAAVLVGCGSAVPLAPPSTTSAPVAGPTSVPASTPAAAPTALGPTVAPTDPSAAPSGTLAAPVTVPAPGTGSAADRMAAETAFLAYLRAVADGDFATACALNAPETNQRLLDELARRGTPAPTCERAIATLYAGSGVAQGAATIANTLTVQRVDVAGDAATVAWSVEVSGQRPVVTNALRRIDGQWRLLPTPGPAG